MTRPSRRRLARALGAVLLVLALAPGAASSERQVSPNTNGSVAIGVAPFERVPQHGSAVPDVALLLSDRLATRGVGRVVGPAEWTRPSVGADAGEVSAWAAEAGLDAIVTGRTTQLGRRLSLDVWLRSGRDGAVAATYVAEAGRAEEVAGAVDRLAAQVIDGLPAALGEASNAAVASAPPKPAGPGAAGAANAAPRSGGLAERMSGPISIRSDELEAIEKGGQRTMVFTRNVRVAQDEWQLRSDRLEAFYPAGASQPERLVARGHVSIRNGEQTASCDEATYLRDQQTVLCRGNARMEQECDWVTGNEIELHLESERLVVRGDTQVHICREEESPAAQAVR
jgi:lipopolysaccharide transport protein LptA